MQCGGLSRWRHVSINLLLLSHVLIGVHRAILDGRVAFEIVNGYAITFEFATVDVLDIWPKMILPNTPGLAERVAGMQGSKIRINFEFEDPVQGSTI